MNKKTLSVFIPAHNESRTIAQVLKEISAQNTNGFSLEKTFVTNDGSTDNTLNVVKRFMITNKHVELIHDDMQRGKIERLNQIFEICTSDYLVILDADVRIYDKNLLNKLILYFDSPDVGLVGGGDLPVKPGNFIEKIAVAGIDLWFETRKNINNGDSVHNNHGCLFALRKSLYKKVIIPRQIISDDEYLYFATTMNGFSFRYAKNANVFYSVPSTFKDYVVQSSRFLYTKNLVTDSVGKWSKKKYTVPSLVKIQALVNSLYKNPIYTLLSVFFQLGLRIIMPFSKRHFFSHVWVQADSTKR